MSRKHSPSNPKSPRSLGSEEHQDSKGSGSTRRAHPAIHIPNDAQSPAFDVRVITTRLLQLGLVAGLLWLIVAWSSPYNAEPPQWLPGSLRTWLVTSGLFVPWNLRHIRCVDDGTWFEARQGRFKFPPSHLRGHGTLPPTAFPFSKETTFHLPANSETFFLLSRGPKLGGGVEIVTSSSLDDVVEVRINARYFRKDLLDRTNVCLSARAEGEYGVSMLSPPRWQRLGHEDHIYFHVTVVLPQGSPSGPFFVNNFETNVPNFFHNVGQLGHDVQFKQFAVQGVDAPIQVQSLTAETARLRTSNGLISGNFLVSTFLALKTSNAPVDALIVLNNSDTTADSSVHILTSNGDLKSTIQIDPSTKLNLFTLNAKTSNAHLDISVPSAPPTLPFFLTATTSNAPATVSVPPTFSGPFRVKTLNDELYVDEREPPVQGRELVMYRTLEQATYGNVKWLDDRPDGAINIKTSNAPVTLVL